MYIVKKKYNKLNDNKKCYKSETMSDQSKK